MQFKLTAALSALIFASLATATPIPGPDDISQCNTGPVQCCNSLQSASTSSMTNLLGLLGIAVGDISGLVGLTCSPLSGTGGGASCAAQPVCCSNNSFNGLINLGCSPINIHF